MSSTSSSTANLDGLPENIVAAITRWLRSARDINSLSRTNHHLHHVATRILYRENILHNDSYALFDGAITGNVGTISNALRLGRANINALWSTSHPHLLSRRLLHHKPALWATDTHPKADQLRTGYTRSAGKDLTPLGFAVMYNNFSAAAYLLGRGAVPSTGLLHLAVHMGHADLVALLLTHSAYHVTCDQVPPSENGGRQTGGFHVLQLALDGAYLDVSRVLIAHSFDQEKLREEPSPNKVKRILGSLVQADQGRFEELVSLLVENGVQVHKWRGDDYDDYGQEKNDTLLTMVAAAREVEKLLFLVTRGLVTAEEERDEALSPEHIHNASVRGHVDMLKYLLTHYGDAGVALPTTTGMWPSGRGRGMATMLEAVLRGPYHLSETVQQRRKRLSGVPDAVKAILGHRREKYTLLNFPVSLEDDERDRRERMPLAFHLWYSPHGAAADEEVEKRDWWCARTTKVMLDAGAEVDQMAVTQMREGWCDGCGEVLLAHTYLQGPPGAESGESISALADQREASQQPETQGLHEPLDQQFPQDPARDMFVQALMNDMQAGFLQFLHDRARR